MALTILRPICCFDTSNTGSAEIAAVGVSIAVFNQVSKVCIYPLVSVTTSFVAEEDAIISKGVEEEKGEDLEKAASADNDMNELPSFGGLYLHCFAANNFHFHPRSSEIHFKMTASEI